MKYPAQKKLLREDLKDAPEWAGKILDSINSSLEANYQAFSKNITDGDNIACQIHELVYRTSAAYPAEEYVYFQRTLRSKATGLTVLQAVDKTTYEPVAGPVYVPWIEDSGRIRISSITGLEASKIYLIRLRLT